MSIKPYQPPKFSIDDSVSVKRLEKDGHVRTQNFIRGKSGRVVEYCGLYLNPEDLAVGRTSGPAVHLYRVAFDMESLWDSTESAAGFNSADQLITEIYEHWLELSHSD